MGTPRTHIYSTNYIFVTKINFNRKKICLEHLFAFFLSSVWSSCSTQLLRMMIRIKMEQHGSTFLHGPFHDSFGPFQPIRTGAKMTMFNNEALFLPLTFLDDQKINLCLLSNPRHSFYPY